MFCPVHNKPYDNETNKHFWCSSCMQERALGIAPAVTAPGPVRPEGLIIESENNLEKPVYIGFEESN